MQSTQGKKRSFLQDLSVPEVHFHLEFLDGVVYDLLVLFVVSG